MSQYPSKPAASGQPWATITGILCNPRGLAECTFRLTAVWYVITPHLSKLFYQPRCEMKHYLSLIVVLAFMANANAQLPPVNPFLADSPWPVSHGNTYAQAASPYPGLPTSGDLAVEFADISGGIPALSIIHQSAPYADGSSTLWAGNFSGYVVKLHARADGRLELIDEFYKGGGIIGQSIYGVIDRNNRFIVPYRNRILAFADEIPGDPSSPIAKVVDYRVPQIWFDMLLAVSLNYEGNLVYVTTGGRVGLVSPDFRQHTSLNLNLPRGSKIRNGIALDEDGGIYLTSLNEVFRVQASDLSISLNWRVSYDMGSNGSGSTASLMGTGAQDKFVLFTDTHEPNNIVLLWRDQIPADWPGLPGYDRRVAAVEPMEFDPRSAYNNENSPAVWGYNLAVSQYSGLGPAINRAVPGVMQFRWDPQARELRRLWYNRDLNINSVMLYSYGSNRIYGVGQDGAAWKLMEVNPANGQLTQAISLGTVAETRNGGSTLQLDSQRRFTTGTPGGMLRVGPAY